MNEDRMYNACLCLKRHLFTLMFM